jgi:Protein phosphatase 2C
MMRGELPFGTGRRPEDDQPRHRRGHADPADALAPVEVPAVPVAMGASRAAAAEDRWAPIVVDEPIIDFEPRPPASRSYRPDTVFDGWSTEDFTVRMASVRGYSHRYSGAPRQDAAEIAFHPKTGAIIFAVADGVSSARESHVGAATACEVAVDVLRWQLGSEHGMANFAEVVDRAANKMVRKAASFFRQGRPDQQDVGALFATTLVVGYVLPDAGGASASMVQIGDSSAWVLRGGRYHPLLEQKHDPEADVISSGVSPLPRVPAYVTPIEFSLPPDAVLLIGTDGFGDPLGDGDGKVGELFAGHLSTPPSSRALAHLLDFSRETFDDDRTLVAVWQQPHEAGDRK